MMIIASDDKLREAVEQAELEDYKTLPSDDEIQWIPSRSYKRKMRNLIKKSQYKTERKFKNTGFKRAAVILVAISMLMGALMTVEAVRNPLIHFITETCDNFTRLFSDTDRVNNSNLQIIERHTISKIPKGYSLKDEINSEFLCRKIWYNSDNDFIGFDQSVCGNDYTLNTEDVEFNEITINNNTVYVTTNAGQTIAVWSDGIYEFQLTCPEEMDYEKLIQSIKKIK